MVMVLLVDDDNARLSSNADALLAQGHQVCTAVNGEEALEELEWNDPDVLVCVSKMPVVDGWELVRQVRDDERLANLRIVLIGTEDDKEVRLAAFRVGVDDYLPWPFEPEELVRRLARTSRPSRVVERLASTSATSDVQGRLENFRLSSVLRLLAVEAKSGVLWVRHPGERIRISLRNGAPLQAEAYGDLSMTWQQCLQSALSWTSGDFFFTEQSVPVENEIRMTVPELLDGALSRAQFGRRA